MAPSEHGDVARTTIVAALAISAALVAGAWLLRPDRAPADAIELATASAQPDDPDGAVGGGALDDAPAQHDDHDDHDDDAPAAHDEATRDHDDDAPAARDDATHDRDDDAAGTTTTAHSDHGEIARPYDATVPVDLGGTDGVTEEQQAFAEDLVERTLRDLPQWADLEVVDAAGFRSIGDGATGHEHYIQWDWIDDDVWLDPNYPESLVFEPQPDGSKVLVSAMYMLPGSTALQDVPDWGGALMQWHVHGDLCFTGGEAPLVAGVKPLGTACAPPLVDGPLSPMIHVWIRPHECGPFAALDGIAGGQVPEGESVLCDHAHGSG